MAAARTAAPAKPRSFDPFRTLWALLCNAKFALFLIGVAVLMGLVGVIVPQLPEPMRQNGAARSAWIELQREGFGALTGVFDRAGLFEIYQAPWFTGLWVLITVAVTVCAVSRLRPTHRLVQQPQRRVPDGYFASAHHRADFSHPGGSEAVEAALRKRHYRVRRIEGGGPGQTLLFGERFAWNLYGTFLSHLALLMLLVGGLLTALAGFDETLAIAEAKPGAPLFSDPGPRQIFLTMRDAHRGIDDDGNIIDFHSDLELRQGDDIVTCTTTVNRPCKAFGFKFHQAAFFDDLAKLRITGPDGRVIFDDILDFENKVVAVPVVRVTDPAGRVLMAGDVPQAGTDAGADPGRSDDRALGVLRFPVAAGSIVEAVEIVAWQVVDGQLRMEFAEGSRLAGQTLTPGDSVSTAEYRIELQEGRNIPAIAVQDLPGASSEAVIAVQLARNGAGEAYLAIAGLAAEAITLKRGAPDAVGSLTFTFGGQVDGAGINARRDPGDTFIWVAVGMAIIGLSITFYVPRRRLWVKVTPTRTHIAGIAEKTTRLSQELRRLGAELGSRDALLPEDTEER